MVDIESPTAEIRRGKKERQKLELQNRMSASATQGGHNNNNPLNGPIIQDDPSEPVPEKNIHSFTHSHPALWLYATSSVKFLHILRSIAS